MQGGTIVMVAKVGKLVFNQVSYKLGRDVRTGSQRRDGH